MSPEEIRRWFLAAERTMSDHVRRVVFDRDLRPPRRYRIPPRPFVPFGNVRAVSDEEMEELRRYAPEVSFDPEPVRASGPGWHVVFGDDPPGSARAEQVVLDASRCQRCGGWSTQVRDGRCIDCRGLPEGGAP